MESETPHPTPDTPLAKLRWRLRHGDPRSILSSLRACQPITDSEVMAGVAEALRYPNVDVRENAANLLGSFGDELALDALRAAAACAADEEERRNHERAAGLIERRLETRP